MKTLKSIFVIIVLWSFTAAQNQNLTGPEVLQKNLIQHVTFLASDKLEGRKIGSTGLSLFPVALLLVKPEIGSVLLEIANDSPRIRQKGEVHQEFRLMAETHIRLKVPYSDQVYQSWNLGGYL